MPSYNAGDGQSSAMNMRESSDFLQMSLPNPVRLGTGEAAILTAPLGGRLVVDSIVLCESSGNATTFTIRKYATTLGNSAANNLYTVVPLAANETVQIDFKGLYLTNGQILAALASVGAHINMDVNYQQEL